MALDTPDEQFSALGYPGGWFYVAPDPSNAPFVAPEDQFQLLGLYRLGAVPPDPVGQSFVFTCHNSRPVFKTRDTRPVVTVEHTQPVFAPRRVIR